MKKQTNVNANGELELTQICYSPNQVAQLYSLSRDFVIRDIRSGTLPHLKKRSRILIKREDVKNYLSV